MSELASAYVRIRPDMSGFKGETQAGVKKGFSGIGKVISGALAGVAVGEVFKAGFDELKEGQKVAAQTAAVLKSTGGAANVTAKEVDALAASTLKKSGIDDEATKSAENLLLTFKDVRDEAGRGNDIFKQATSAIVDMDVAMTHGNTTAESLHSTTILVGKALNDPIKGMTALRRVGVTLNETQQKTVKSLVAQGKTMQAQKLILRELNSEFGGSAAALGDTLPGKLDILRETFRNDLADMLAAATPTLVTIANFATNVLPTAFRVAGDVIHEVAAQVQEAAGVIAPALEPVADAIRPIVAAFQDGGFTAALKEARAEFDALPGPAKIAAVAIAGIAAAMLALTSPVAAVVLAGEALYQLYTRSKTARDVIDRAMADIRARVAEVSAFISQQWALHGAEIEADTKAFIGTVRTVITDGLTAVRAFWDRFGAAITSITKTYLSTVVAVIRAEIQIIENVFKLIGDVIHGRWADAWSDLKGIVSGAFAAVVALIRGQIRIFATIGLALAKALSDGLKAGLLFIGVQVVAALKGLGDAIEGAARSAYHLAIDIGKQIVEGVIDGAKSLPGRLGDALRSGVGSAFSGVKGFLESRSPSKKAAREIGKPLADGIVDGFLQGINGLAPAMTKSIKKAVTSVSTSVRPSAHASGGALSYGQVEGYWIAAGGDPRLASTMAAIATRESSRNPRAHNYNPGTGDDSWGLWQINYLGGLGAPRTARYGPREGQVDPYTNAKAAVDLERSSGLSPWTTSKGISRWVQSGIAPILPSVAGAVTTAVANTVKRVLLAIVPTVPVGQLTGAANLPGSTPSFASLPGIGVHISALAKKAAKAGNAGAAAEDALRQEQDLLTLAYDTLKAKLAKTKGEARDQIEAAMEDVHRRVGRVGLLIQDAVVTIGDALLPDKLRTRLAEEGRRGAALADQATTAVGALADEYRTEIQKNLTDQRAALQSAVAGLKSQLVGALPHQRAAILAELAKMQGQLTNVNSQVLAGLQGIVQSVQTKVSTLFGSVKSKIDAQFEAQTQRLLDAVGAQFFQGTLTPAEQALKAAQTAQTQNQLQANLTAAQQAVRDSLGQGQAAYDLAQQQLAAAQEAIRMDRLQADATRERNDADRNYAAAVKKITDERTAEEAQLNTDLDALSDGLVNGTATLSDLRDVADKYGVTITAKAIPEMAGLASATALLSHELRALAAFIARITGTSGDVATTSASDAFNTVFQNAFKNALAGLNVPGLATGGLVKYRPGGTIVRVAEKADEEVVPAGTTGKRLAAALAPLQPGLEAILRVNERMLAQLEMQTQYASSPAMTANAAAKAAAR